MSHDPIGDAMAEYSKRKHGVSTPDKDEHCSCCDGKPAKHKYTIAHIAILYGVNYNTLCSRIVSVHKVMDKIAQRRLRK